MNISKIDQEITPVAVLNLPLINRKPKSPAAASKAATNGRKGCVSQNPQSMKDIDKYSGIDDKKYKLPAMRGRTGIHSQRVPCHLLAIQKAITAPMIMLVTLVHVGTSEGIETKMIVRRETKNQGRSIGHSRSILFNSLNLSLRPI